MAKLTKAEEKLLRHPPTPRTWLCEARRKSKDSGDTYLCLTPNSGSNKRCWLCATPRPPVSRRKRLWPSYEAACKKAGIEPGTRWPIRVRRTKGQTTHTPDTPASTSQTKALRGRRKDV